MRSPIVLLLLATLCATLAVDQAIEDEEIRAEEFLAGLNVELNRQANQIAEASWAYGSNITDHNERVKNDVMTAGAAFSKSSIAQVRSFNYAAYKNEDLKRQFRLLSEGGAEALPEDEYRQLLDAVSAMESNYAKVRVCNFHKRTECDMQLEPEISDVFEHSSDPEELKYYWQQWYDKAGTPVRSHFDTYVRLVNRAAELNNHTNNADAWLSVYEDEHFEQQLEGIFDQVRPLYEQIHGYVRQKLVEQYGSGIVCPNGPIPMHLLRNMWGQSWEHIAAETTPYPEKTLLDVTAEMVRQNYTALKMFQMGDEFFQSLNMTKLPQEFWDKSIIEKPADGRELVCHASAWDFYVHNDVRIKQCTRVTMDQLFTVHHELGHIQYYLQYQDQPNVYRQGANPGFHEAVGDVLALSVSTPKHLQTIGLLKDYVEDEQTKINQLFRDAMEKVVFLPFAYTLDKYRWSIFRGQVPTDHYNTEFWRLREEYSGIQPPVKRTDSEFDAAAKYHISADVEYLRYLVSFIVQFQFHKAACEKAGEYEAGNPLKTLSNCDIYQSANAGNAIKAMLSMGSSKPWPDAMEVLTGTRKMEASAILEYFKPLYDWLVKTNAESGTPIGWKNSSCSPSNEAKEHHKHKA